MKTNQFGERSPLNALVRRAVHSALVSSAAIVLAMPSAQAQDSSIAEIVVTGSRVRLKDFESVSPVTTVAHQLHGAIGVTIEHPLWTVTTRAQSWASDYGTTVGHARRLGRMALNAADPWDVIVGNIPTREKS